MASVYTKGTRVWLPDKEAGWVPGTVTSVAIPGVPNPDSEVVITVSIDGRASDEGGSKEFKCSFATLQSASESNGNNLSSGSSQDVLPPSRNPPLSESSEDLASLSNLNEPSVLHAIATRYATHQPYTYSGIVSVALNPFSPVPLYGNDISQAYAGKRKGDMEPHLFAIAEEASDSMRRGSGNGGVDPTGAGDQTIVVSGESGAGKTVSAKYILRYFASVINASKETPVERRRLDSSGDDEGMSEIERQILASNPIMEAFGNAKTTRNDNSSRFGKYIEVLFDNENEIVGARIRTYLLERSRLVYQPDTERNYHIFYQSLAGAPAKERKDSSSPADPQQFAYSAGGGPSSSFIAGVDDAKEFRDTQEALSTVGISVERQWHIFKVLAALSHLGNVKITQSRTDAVSADDDPALALATSLLGSPLSEFKKWTIKKQLTTRSEKIVTNLGSAQATVVRDSVAKFIYSCLFDWLVGAVNDSSSGENASTSNRFIGVSDIYGFEHFKKNSFEQFCINWANEKSQQEFNAHVFKLEQEEYMREEINWTFIDFTDNQACIDVIEGKMGVLTLLDEESRLPSGADASFANKLHQQLGPKPEYKDVFKKPRFNQNAFTIAHYAHDVTYDADGFLEKNRDTVPDEHLALLQSSSNDFLREAITRSLDQAASSSAAPVVEAKPGPKRGGATRKPTLGSIFKHSLISLMDTINHTNVHYIRCIKPNEAKKAWTFEPQQVLSQSRACGVLETIRISCAGYPSRWTFAEFASRYYVSVNSKEWEGNSDVKAFCQLSSQRTSKDENKYQIGSSKIFFRAGMVALSESLRTARLNALVTLVQKNVRRRIAYKHYQDSRRRTITIQSWWRGIQARRLVEQMRRDAAATSSQRAARGVLQRRAYANTRQAVVTIQAAIRGHQARQRFREQRTESAVLQSQSLFRGHATRLRYRGEIRRIIVSQSQWRRKLAVRELKTSKAEAKSADKLKEISYQLENKVVELTKTLQKRTGENKSLKARISDSEKELATWQLRHEEAQARSASLESKLAEPTVPRDKFDEVMASRNEHEERLRTATRRMTELDEEITRSSTQLERATVDANERQAAIDSAVAKHGEDESTIQSLRHEITSSKEQISRASALQALTKGGRDAPPSPTMDRGSRDFANGSHGGEARNHPPARRRIRRHSTTGHGAVVPHSEEDALDLRKPGLNAPRAVSVMFPQNNLLRPRDSNGLPTSNDSSADEVARLLEDEEGLDDDVLHGLIASLKIPAASLHNPPLAKEVIFPAHLISLVSNEMWKLGMIPESERFSANVMQSIQSYVMQFKGEEVIVPGIFWLSNVQEILSFICVAESDAQQGIAPGMDEPGGRELDWEAYERLVGIVKHDLDSSEYNIYHTWMLEVKKKLGKMVIPALIESQSLPGFITSDGSGRMFQRMIGMGGGNNQPTASMDDISNSLNKVWKCLKSYYMEESVMQQVVTESSKSIGTIAFNDLIMRRNFCSWKRAMQIQYNITRIEEWCKAHDMPEGLLQLEHLMQATKLSQLKKASMGDIEILFDVCWILSPSQIQKLISQYHNADYEAPISPDILKAVAARVRPEDKNDQSLSQTEQDEVGPYQIPPPRDIAGLETYVPAWLNVPLIRRLATFVA